MTLPLHRGLSTNRTPESSWSQEDAPSRNHINGKETEDSTLHAHNSASTYSLRLLTKQPNQEHLAGSLNPLDVPHQRSGDNGFKYSSRTSDDGVPSDLIALKSPLLSFQRANHLYSRRSEICSCCYQANVLNSLYSLFSRSLRNRQGLAVPLGKCIMLCFVSIFVLVSVLGSSRTGYSISSAPTLDNFRTYRRFQQEISPDFSNGGIFGMGTVRAKELTVCAREMEDHVPCYNISASRHASFKNGEEYDRHCELTGREIKCLIRPPKQYRIPLKWPACRDGLWSGNVKVTKEQLQSAGTRTKRLMMDEEDWISFHSKDGRVEDGMKSYSRQIATIVGFGNDNGNSQAGVRTILDIGCGFGSFGSHVSARNLLTLCLAPYEIHASRVQFALERGLPAMIGSLIRRQLPFSRSSFDMIHCSDCGVDWRLKDGLLLIEADRLLKAGGHFVWTSPLVKHENGFLRDKDEKKWNAVVDLAERMCWVLVFQQEQTAIWRKTAEQACYSSRGQNARPHVCDSSQDADSSWYQPLKSCIVAVPNDGHTSIHSEHIDLSSEVVIVDGLSNEELLDDSGVWTTIVKNYWSLLTPLIFSDHPKRPSDDDPRPPSNMVRNVMDMNAAYGSLNAALLQAGKSVWVMNVVPTSGVNTLPIIYNRGYLGTLHDWCEAFPSYPRTYDLLHAIGLLSQELKRPNGCGLSKLFLEMDRILRPEGWVFLRDKLALIEDARLAAVQMRWEARVIEVDSDSELRLLVCQKIFWKS